MWICFSYTGVSMCTWPIYRLKNSSKKQTSIFRSERKEGVSRLQPTVLVWYCSLIGLKNLYYICTSALWLEIALPVASCHVALCCKGWGCSDSRREGKKIRSGIEKRMSKNRKWERRKRKEVRNENKCLTRQTHCICRWKIEREGERGGMCMYAFVYICVCVWGSMYACARLHMRKRVSVSVCESEGDIR